MDMEDNLSDTHGLGTSGSGGTSQTEGLDESTFSGNDMSNLSQHHHLNRRDSAVFFVKSTGNNFHGPPILSVDARMQTACVVAVIYVWHMAG